MPSGLKIVTAGVVLIVGLFSSAVIGLRDANRRPDYCARCHVTAPNVDTWISSDYLAFKHAQSAISCQRCHERSVKRLLHEVVSTATHSYQLPLQENRISSEDCMRCHGDRNRLAELTANLPRNPHNSPHGEQECRDCHQMHKPSVDACAACHEPVASGPGWVKPQ